MQENLVKDIKGQLAKNDTLLNNAHRLFSGPRQVGRMAYLKSLYQNNDFKGLLTNQPSSGQTTAASVSPQQLKK